MTIASDSATVTDFAFGRQPTAHMAGLDIPVHDQHAALHLHLGGAHGSDGSVNFLARANEGSGLSYMHAGSHDLAAAQYAEDNNPASYYEHSRRPGSNDSTFSSGAANMDDERFSRRSSSTTGGYGTTQGSTVSQPISPPEHFEAIYPMYTSGAGQPMVQPTYYYPPAISNHGHGSARAANAADAFEAGAFPLDPLLSYYREDDKQAMSAHRGGLDLGSASSFSTPTASGTAAVHHATHNMNSDPPHGETYDAATTLLTPATSGHSVMNAVTAATEKNEGEKDRGLAPTEAKTSQEAHIGGLAAYYSGLQASDVHSGSFFSGNATVTSVGSWD